MRTISNLLNQLENQQVKIDAEIKFNSNGRTEDEVLQLARGSFYLGLAIESLKKSKEVLSSSRI